LYQGEIFALEVDIIYLSYPPSRIYHPRGRYILFILPTKRNLSPEGKI